MNKKVPTFLGMKINKALNTIELDQKDYTEQVLEKYRMMDAKPARTLRAVLPQVFLLPLLYRKNREVIGKANVENPNF